MNMAKRKTQREALLVGLRKRGFTEAERQTTGRYLIMRAPEGATLNANYYVGRAAALRYGRTVSASVAFNDNFRRKLIEEGRT